MEGKPLRMWNGEPVPPEMLEQIKPLEAISEGDIDFTDAPEVKNCNGARRGGPHYSLK